MNGPHLLACVLLSVTSLCPDVCAQRDAAEVEWQKRSAAIDYGVVPVGKHGIEELKDGEPWRLGMGDATTWRTEMPVVVGEAVVPPGRYRLSFVKTGAAIGEIQVQGSGAALAFKNDVVFPGGIGDREKPSKALELKWSLDKDNRSKVNQPAVLEIAFGDRQWRGDAVLLGGKEQRLGKGRLVSFALPWMLFVQHTAQPVPVATFEKGKGKNVERWNLVLIGKEAKFVPWGEVPAGFSAFAPIPVPPESSIVTGALRIGSVEGKATNTDAVTELVEAKVGKDGFELIFVAGNHKRTVTIAEPGK